MPKAGNMRPKKGDIGTPADESPSSTLQYAHQLPPWLVCGRNWLRLCSSRSSLVQLAYLSANRIVLDVPFWNVVGMRRSPCRHSVSCPRPSCMNPRESHSVKTTLLAP